ncbi:hypothetical protein ACK12G_20850 [Mycolicibacterium wolinskyi]|uniref:hypothetical protein n=1 Tax=Mycolicibacterium wolinskyi TaxID=59750 RepID=UPI003917B1AB
MSDENDSLIEPSRPTLDPKDSKTSLHENVRNALLALPGDFSFEHSVSGIAAVDLFNLNTLMGAGIEAEVVRTLNTLRKVWDPENEWSGFSFERSSQAFPDVRLVRHYDGHDEIAIGIELKGWFLLAKEGAPSLRYQVAPAACAPHDLVCVVPWYLSNAVSGIAQVAEPWVESARFAAEWRDHWWQHIRNVRNDTHPKGVIYPDDAAPYPTKADLVTAKAEYDGGDNYGRLPRCKPLMDQFIEKASNTPILDISAKDWVWFLRLHTDTANPEDVTERLAAEVARKSKAITPEVTDEIVRALKALRDATTWLDE